MSQVTSLSFGVCQVHDPEGFSSLKREEKRRESAWTLSFCVRRHPTTSTLFAFYRLLFSATTRFADDNSWKHTPSASWCDKHISFLPEEDKKHEKIFLNFSMTALRHRRRVECQKCSPEPQLKLIEHNLTKLPTGLCLYILLELCSDVVCTFEWLFLFHTILPTRMGFTITTKPQVMWSRSIHLLRRPRSLIISCLTTRSQSYGKF